MPSDGHPLRFKTNNLLIKIKQLSSFQQTAVEQQFARTFEKYGGSVNINKLFKRITTNKTTLYKFLQKYSNSQSFSTLTQRISSFLLFETNYLFIIIFTALILAAAFYFVSRLQPEDLWIHARASVRVCVRHTISGDPRIRF